MIASLLYYQDIDIAEYLPSTLRFAPGWKTLLGTTSDDVLTLKWNFKHIYGGEGQDTLEGTNGNITPEKLYGGKGNDTFLATTGYNIYHGGEYGLDYEQDGIDSVHYRDIGIVTLSGNPAAVEHNIAEFNVVHAGGFDQFFSIEEIVWDTGSNTVLIGPNVEAIPDYLRMKFGDQSSLDRGDGIDFSAAGVGLSVNYDADGSLVIQANAENAGKGIWIEGAEWLTGSAKDDRIYTAPTLTMVDGGDGNDLIDVRASTPFEKLSPRAFDVEISGGKGDDTIVAGGGYTAASGGEGADRFILSTVTLPDGQRVEFVIEDASAEDRAYIPYDLFGLDFSDFEDSALFPLLGALSQLPGQASFADLPQNIGPWAGSSGSRSDFFRFEWQLQHDRHYGSNELDGVIDFTGGIYYNRDGADLLIHIFLGDGFEVTEDGNDGHPWTHVINSIYGDSETVIRVTDFEDGDLGIHFYDIGTPTAIDVSTDHGTYSVLSYANWDAAVLAITNGGQMLAPLETRPEAPAFLPNEQEPDDNPLLLVGSAADDILTALAAARLEGGAGNDTLNGSAENDVLDGGAGDDQLVGGSGDDTYIVNDAGDVVVEATGGGRDRVIASLSFTLPDNVEILELAPGAVSGFGNDAANQLFGSDADDMLSGLAGNDILFGHGGNDILDGGDGSDTYGYGEGNGIDVIRDAGPAGDIDILVLSDARAMDVTILRLATTPDDLVLAFADGGRVRIENFDGPPGSGIEVVRFQDGVQWNRTDLEARAALAPILENDLPFARDDYEFMAASGVVVVPSLSLLANDSDGDGDALSIIAIGEVSSNATVTLRLDGNLDLVTAEGADGVVSFTYTVSDGHGGQSTARTEIQIIPNHAPVAALGPATLSALEGTPWSYVLPTSQFTDADGDTLTYAATLASGAALPAWLSFNPTTRTFSGTPPNGSASTLDLKVTASDGLAIGALTLPLTISSGVLKFIGTSAAETLTGTAGNDIIIGRGGADILHGLGGDDVFEIDGNDGLDTFDGGAGYDVIRGGTKDDTIGLLHGSASLAGIEAIDGGAGYDVLKLSSGDDILDLSGIAVISLEEIRGVGGNDRITGTSGRDVISGGAGDDVLIGGSGDDDFLVSGTTGFDDFDGGIGFDRILGSAGDDTIGLLHGSLSLTGIEAIDGGAGNDVLRMAPGGGTLDLSSVAVSGIEDIRGSNGDDTIIGSSGNDRITGAAGDDIIDGGAGDDTFIVSGNSGVDVYNGGIGFDRIVGSSGDDKFVFANVAGNLSGIEVIDGGGGNDIIQLTAGDDTLDLLEIEVIGIAQINLGAGDDTVIASRANDVLRGGGGADTFIFTGRFGRDTILDFQRGTASNPLVDVIDLRDAEFADFADLLAHSVQDGADTVINASDISSVRLIGITLGSLHADDFRLA